MVRLKLVVGTTLLLACFKWVVVVVMVVLGDVIHRLGLDRLKLFNSTPFSHFQWHPHW